MRYLLDTQAFIWLVQDDSRFGSKARAALKDLKTELYLSAASVWEISIKVGLGKLSLERSMDAVLEEVKADGLRSLSISWEHAREVERLPAIHKDPFDRLIVAQAKVEGMVLLSSDKILGRYPVKVVW